LPANPDKIPELGGRQKALGVAASNSGRPARLLEKEVRVHLNGHENGKSMPRTVAINRSRNKMHRPGVDVLICVNVAH
jgi:hypothetical protein